MIISEIEATIFYSHTQEEVEELAQAIEPIGDHIRAVSSQLEVQRMRAILAGSHFRRRDVSLVTKMLLRAAKHARAHLDEYFWADTVIAQAEALEDAVERYREGFKALQSETVAVN